MDTISQLMLLYQQAVEYYDGINDDKNAIYQDRIQNMLIRPEILAVMSNASKNPEAQRKEEEARKERLDSMAPDELEKLRQEEMIKRKKERAAKMRLNSGIQDAVRMETDEEYKQASKMYEQKAKLAVVAERDIKRDLSAQRSQLKLRLEARKKNKARNGSFFEENDTVLKRMPMSTRASSFIPNRFANSAGSAMEEGLAYAPNTNNRSGADQSSGYMNFNKQKSAEGNHLTRMQRGSVSTRANDPMKMIFPNEDSTEAKGDMINDISGIVHDISNVEETSFLMHLDSMNTRLGGNGKAKLHQNLCKSVWMFIQPFYFSSLCQIIYIYINSNYFD